MSEPGVHIDWQPQSSGLARLRGLRDDPGRIVLLVAAALLLAGAFLPWASGIDPTGHPVTYTAQEGLAEGFILLVIALILLFLAGTRALIESTTRTFQLLPLVFAVIAGAMWLGAERQSLEHITDWTTLGGSGSQTVMRLVTGLGIVLVVVGTIWLEFTRPADVKARTPSLRTEWRISKVNALEGVVAAIFAIGFAATAGVATMVAVGPDGSFFAVFMVLLGMGFGISVGLGLVRWIRGGEEHASVQPSLARRGDIEVAKVVRKRP